MATAPYDESGWYVPLTISGPGEKTITFQTENKFVDRDARAIITTPSASGPELTLTDKTGSLSMGTASSGQYSPTATFTGNISVATAGWIAAGNHTVSDEDVVVGKVNESTMLNGQSPVASGSTVTPGPSEQTITITEGYNSARTLVIGSASSSSPGSVTSGSATISSLSYAYDSSGQQFNITGTADVSAPTVGTAGYVSGSVGTLNANTGGASVVATVDEISLAVGLSGATTARKPTLSKQSISISGVTDAANGSATATAPSSGAYVAIRSAANTETITATPSVYSAGYGTTSNYNVNANATATVGAAQSDIYYVPIKVGTITSGTASITSTSIAYNSTSGKFDITGSANVSAPTFTEGYIATNVGTKNGKTNGATLSDELDKIAIGASISGTGTFTPSIVKHSNTNITTAGSATTSQPASGYYVAVNSAASTGTVTATPSVTTAGYGTTTSGQYTATTDTLTVGASASSTTYIPIGSATLANTATSGTTYTDTSSTAPVLISGSYLFINEGYISNQKISLAQLVPDGASASLSGDYILSGYSAYDSDGALVAGSIQTYDGSYTIT